MILIKKKLPAIHHQKVLFLSWCKTRHVHRGCYCYLPLVTADSLTDIGVFPSLLGSSPVNADPNANKTDRVSAYAGLTELAQLLFSLSVSVTILLLIEIFLTVVNLQPTNTELQLTTTTPAAFFACRRILHCRIQIVSLLVYSGFQMAQTGHTPRSATLVYCCCCCCSKTGSLHRVHY